MGPTIFVVKGVSGSGKSSRIFQLLEYFHIHKGLSKKPLWYEKDFKKHPVGEVIEQERIAFVGKRYKKSGKIERWQGLDSVTHVFVSSEEISNWLGNLGSKYIVIIDGTSVTKSHRFRPEYLHKLGFNNICIQYYNFSGNEESAYLKRVVERSGKEPLKGTMWQKWKSFEAETEKSVNEAEQLIKKGNNVVVEYDSFNASIKDFGYKYLEFFERDVELPEFDKFVDDFDYINRNKFENQRNTKPLF